MLQATKSFCFFGTGFMVLALFFAKTSFAENCYSDCMVRSGCSNIGSNSDAFCSDSSARCTTECRQPQSNHKSFGAIAYSAKDGGYGYSDSFLNRKEAEKTALKYCKKYGKNCKGVVWFYNNCGAVAADGQKVAWGLGDSANEAAAQAMKQCQRRFSFFKKNCEVKATHCSW